MKNLKSIIDEALGITFGSTQLVGESGESDSQLPFRKISNNFVGYYETKFESIMVKDEGSGINSIKYYSKENKGSKTFDNLEPSKLPESLDKIMIQDDKMWC